VDATTYDFLQRKIDLGDILSGVITVTFAI
jgi:hypothetical protein